MRRIGLIAAAAVLCLATAPSVMGRADVFYTVHCLDPDGNPTVNESVDAHAIEQGGKLGAIANFDANNPKGWFCWAEGPFTG